MLSVYTIAYKLGVLMSAYIHFFIRHNDDFTCLATFGRSHELYKAFDGIAPWEKLAALNKEKIAAARRQLDEYANDVKASIQRLKEQMGLIKDFNDTIENKLEIISEYQDEIVQWEEDLKSINYALNYTDFLENILEEVDARKYYENLPPIDPAQVLYVGIETGSNVDKSMIQ